MKKYMVNCFVLFCMILVILSGCSSVNSSEDSVLALIKDTNSDPLSVEDTVERKEIAKEIKEETLAFEEIYDSAIVLGEEDCLVAIKVHHLQRFGMKKIEQELKKSLEKKFVDTKFIVSSDYKIFLESVRLKNKANTLKKEEKEERLQKIIKLSAEQT